MTKLIITAHVDVVVFSGVQEKEQQWANKETYKKRAKENQYYHLNLKTFSAFSYVARFLTVLQWRWWWYNSVYESHKYFFKIFFIFSRSSYNSETLEMREWIIFLVFIFRGEVIQAEFSALRKFLHHEKSFRFARENFSIRSPSTEIAHWVSMFTNDLHRDEKKVHTHLHPLEERTQFSQAWCSLCYVTGCRWMIVLVCAIRVSFLRFSHRKERTTKGTFQGISRKKVKLFGSNGFHRTIDTYPKHQVHQNDEEFNDRAARIHGDDFFLCLTFPKFFLR